LIQRKLLELSSRPRKARRRHELLRLRAGEWRCRCAGRIALLL